VTLISGYFLSYLPYSFSHFFLPPLHINLSHSLSLSFFTCFSYILISYKNYKHGVNFDSRTREKIQIDGVWEQGADENTWT
jgi:hypothetical protein